MEVKNSKATSSVAGSLMVAARLSKVELDYHMIFKGCANCSAPAKITCPCSTKLFCSEACERIVWTERGHHKVCQLLREMREAADVRRAAQRSRADEARARIRAEHDAARARREAEPERKPPLSERFGSRCPICLEDWDVNVLPAIRSCCCMQVCHSCETIHEGEMGHGKPCCFCRRPSSTCWADERANIIRHVQANVSEALYLMGFAYERGHLGGVKDLSLAFDWYQRAANLGNVPAMTTLAYFFMLGRGCEPDRKQAMALFRLAANAGHHLAQYEYAFILRGSSSAAEAFSYLKLSAEQGYRAAQLSLAATYETGCIRVKPDSKEAMRWYRLAAIKGDAEDYYRLGRLDDASYIRAPFRVPLCLDPLFPSGRARTRNDMPARSQAFMLYCGLLRPEIEKANPELTPGALGKKLADSWHEMDDAKKAEIAAIV